VRELVYYVATSIDGYIAGPDGQFDAFPVVGDHMEVIVTEFADALPAPAAAALGAPQSGSLFDTVLMGWNTYNVGASQGLVDPYPHLRQYVFSRSVRDVPYGIVATDRDPVELVRKLKIDEGSAIWLCGGGSLAAALVEEIDRLIVKVNPVLFGTGIPLFDGLDYLPRNFGLTRSRTFESGVTIAEYSASSS
jgi:dihydrofolate reductase